MLYMYPDCLHILQIFFLLLKKWINIFWNDQKKTHHMDLSSSYDLNNRLYKVFSIIKLQKGTSRYKSLPVLLFCFVFFSWGSFLISTYPLARVYSVILKIFEAFEACIAKLTPERWPIYTSISRIRSYLIPPIPSSTEYHLYKKKFKNSS